MNPDDPISVTMTAPPPPPPAELLDELVEEILLRVPPDDPACLARAAVVCKRWCRLVTDAGFRRRFRQFHRTLPLLGFVVSRETCDGDTNTDFLARSSFRPADADLGSNMLLDARHGRILLLNTDEDHYDDFHYYDVLGITGSSKELIFWTPSTGEVLALPELSLRLSCHRTLAVASALLCAAPGCDHMECPCRPKYCGGGPFSVILVCGDNYGQFIYAYVYSTEDEDYRWWSETASIELPGRFVDQNCTSAVARNAIYFQLQDNQGILEYNLPKKELSVVGLPPICNVSTIIVLMAVEEDGLGFAMVNDDFSLCIWWREPALTPSGGWTWLQHRVVDIKSFLPVPALSSSLYILAAADAVGVFVIWTSDAGVLAIDLKSSQATKLCDGGDVVNIIPYMSFCTPGLPSGFSAWQS